MARYDFSSQDIATIIQKSMEPFVTKLEGKVDRLESKVDNLAQDRVTRSDMEKLRSELIGTMVPRDSYEPRHASLIIRDAQLEDNLKQLDTEVQEKFQRFHERLESEKKQIEDRFTAHTNEHTKQKDAELSIADRRWVRSSQISGHLGLLVSVFGILITIILLIAQHIHWSP